MSFISNLNWRTATKAFNTDKPVLDADIATIKESIRMAPTSFGLQPFHVTIITNEELKTKLRASAYDQAQITTCSHLFVFSAKTDLTERADSLVDMLAGGDMSKKEGLKGLENMIKGSIASRSADELKGWAAQQAYIALGFALAACAELQIDSCPMEGFDNAAFKDALALPADLEPMALLAVGYRAENAPVYPKVRFTNEDLFDTK